MGGPPGRSGRETGLGSSRSSSTSPARRPLPRPDRLWWPFSSGTTFWVGSGARAKQRVISGPERAIMSVPAWERRWREPNGLLDLRADGARGLSVLRPRDLPRAREEPPVHPRAGSGKPSRRAARLGRRGRRALRSVPTPRRAGPDAAGPEERGIAHGRGTV